MARAPVAWWPRACAVLRQDAVLNRLLDAYPGESLLASEDLMSSMVRAVCGQQLNNAAARRLTEAVMDFAGQSRARDLALCLAGAAPDALGALGMTRSKARALTGLGQAYADGGVSDESLHGMDDAAVLERLCRIAGVGPWTAHMVLIFGLNRPDVFPVTDLGIIKACGEHFGGVAQAGQLSQAWRPWRTAATWLLWRSRSTTAVTY